MGTVMGPVNKLTQADIAVNYYLILGVGARWSEKEITKYIEGFDKAYGGFVPKRHAERAFWYMRRRAREVLLSPLRKDYDKQRRLWYLGAHGTLNTIVMLEFDQCPPVLFSEGDVDVWSCIHAFLFHCTPLYNLRIGPRLTILAHFVWATRTVLLQYWRERSADELTDSITGAWNVPYHYIESLAKLCYDGTIWHREQWARLLDILTEHDMAHAFRNGERRAWFWFSVKFLEGVGADGNAMDAALLELEMHRDLTSEGILHLGPELVVLGKDLAHQLPWAPSYENSCTVVGREPLDGISFPNYEGEDLARAFTAWYARVRQRIAASQGALDWDDLDLTALWAEYLGEANDAFACSTPEFPPAPRWLSDRRVIRAQTEAALADLDGGEEDKTPHATPRLAATQAAPLPELDEFNLDSRRMSDDEMRALEIHEEAKYRAEKKKGKMKAPDQDNVHSAGAQSETEEDSIRGLSPKLGRAIKKSVLRSRTWQPALEEQVKAWRAEHGYEHHVPRIPRAAYEALKDQVVLECSESLVSGLKLAFEINAMQTREENSAGGHCKYDKPSDEDDDDTVVTIPDDESQTSAVNQWTEDRWAEYDEVVTVLSEEEYEALAIGNLSDTYQRPRSADHNAPVDTSGNPAQGDVDEDPFAFHGGDSNSSSVQGYDVPATPRLSHLPPPGFEPLPMQLDTPESALTPPPAAPQPRGYRNRRRLEYLHSLDHPPVSRKNVRDCRPIKELSEPRDAAEAEAYMHERNELEEVYNAIDQHCALVDSGSDSDSDDGWGDADLTDLFHTPTRPLSPKNTNVNSHEPIDREGATSRAEHRNGDNSAETPEIANGAITHYEDYPLSDGEDEEPENAKKSKNKKRKDKNAGKKNTEPAGFAVECEASSSASGTSATNVADAPTETPGSSVGPTPTGSIKRELGPIPSPKNTPDDDYDFIVPIQDLTGASGSGQAHAAHRTPSAAANPDPIEWMTVEQLARCIPNGEKYLSSWHKDASQTDSLAGSSLIRKYLQATANGNV